MSYRGPYGDGYCRGCESERGERYRALRERFEDEVSDGANRLELRRLQREADGLVDACICDEIEGGGEIMSGAWRNRPFEERQAQTERLRKLAMAPGAGAGSAMIYAMLTQEEIDGQIDWREAALILADAVNKFHKIASDATALAVPAPPILIRGHLPKP